MSLGEVLAAGACVFLSAHGRELSAVVILLCFVLAELKRIAAALKGGPQ